MSSYEPPASVNLRISGMDIPDPKQLMSAEFAALNKKNPEVADLLSGLSRKTFGEIGAVLNLHGMGWNHFIYAPKQEMEHAVELLRTSENTEEKDAAKAEIIRLANL